MQIEAQSLCVCVCVCVCMCVCVRVCVRAALSNKLRLGQQQRARPTGDSGEGSSAEMDSHGICGQLFSPCLFPLIDPRGVIRMTLAEICCGSLTGRI